MYFHYHLSDSTIQNTGSTHQNMTVLMDYLSEKKLLHQNATLYCNTDGTAKQYRCANVICYLSFLSTKYNNTIDRKIGALCHGNDIVYGLNAVDKYYLKNYANNEKSRRYRYEY